MPEDLDGALAPAAPPAARRRPPRPRGRGRAPARRATAVAAGRAAARSTSRTGRQLQVVTYDGAGPRTRNEAYDGARRPTAGGRRAAGRAVRQLARADDHRDGAAAGDQEGRGAGAPASAEPNAQHTEHDRAEAPPDRPGRPAVHGAGCRRRQATSGRCVPARAGRLRSTDADLPADRPLRVVDLGCGNAYLTFAAYRYLSERARRRRSSASTCGRRRGSATPRSPPSSAGPSTCASWPGCIIDAPLRRRRGGRRAGPARLRHGHRRRAGPGGALGGPGGARLAVLPPRPAAAAQGRHARRAVRPARPGTRSCASASATRSPTRCVRHCCAGSATASRSCSSWPRSTPRATR